MNRPIAPRPAAFAVLVVVAATVLAGCTAVTDSAPTETSVSVAATTPPESTATAPALVSTGDAAANLPYFSQIVQSVAAGAGAVSGRAYVDALVAGGFDKAAMQVTEDTSTVGNPAESLQFSVRWGQECLIGQVGPSTGQPVSVVMPGLAAGGCLVGNTRVIDW